ncbi:MAG TPA: hypothetical protein VGQ58_00810 [Candidatus Limnocylindrales bacterium]|jgi:hypothetical protein|nr:hypothetical protein [Candidatus Limnocylindrales bacterium]
MSAADDRPVVRLEIPIESDEDVRALRAALLAARATELAEMRRRSGRLSWGYGSDSARESMSAEVDDRERRWKMLDRLLAALDEPGR